MSRTNLIAFTRCRKPARPSRAPPGATEAQHQHLGEVARLHCDAHVGVRDVTTTTQPVDDLPHLGKDLSKSRSAGLGVEIVPEQPQRERVAPDLR